MVRILHVVSAMNRNGVETWLMHVLRHIDREQFHMDFAVHTNRAAAYDEEARALGSRIIPCLHPLDPLVYAQHLKLALKEYGPYDVVHSHVHHYSGLVLKIAEQLGVPARIAHAHIDTSQVEAHASTWRRIYFALMRRWIIRHATRGFGCSRAAAGALFGPRWASDPRWRVLYYGIDLGPFHQTVKQDRVRAELGFPRGACVVGHVGRFAAQKNHRFIVDIAREMVWREPQAHFLLVGDGPLREAVKRMVERAGLSEHFVFAGARSDVARLMLGAMDVFVFPSLYEGLSLVLLEAQAAGLPCVISSVIPREVEYFPSLFRRLDLVQPPSAWAEAVLAMRRSSGPARLEALASFEGSVFNIETAVRELEKEYGG